MNSIELLRTLVAFDTTSRNSNLALVDWAVCLLERAGARIRLTYDDAHIKANVLASFGPERLIWGSDWPVVTLRADYDRWFDTASALLAGLTEPQRLAIFGGTARRIYLSHRGRD